MVDISVIIVSYNTKYFLEQTINSVINAINDLSVEIIVVDNNSADDSLKYLRSNIEFPVYIIESGTNIGFASANNKGIKKAKGKYILLLNPDTFIQKDTLSICFDFAENNPKIGAVGVRMVDGSGNYLPESKRSIPTPTNSFWKLSGIANLFPRSNLFSNYNLGNIAEDEDAEVGVLCGAFMFIPRALLIEIDGLDEDYFMYGEDIDLSYRIKKANQEIHYLGSHSIIHYKGQSTQKSSVEYVNTFYNAMSIFAKKHYGASGMLVFLLAIGIYLRRFGSIVKRLFSHFGFIILDVILFTSGFLLIKNYWAKFQFSDANYYADSNIILNIFIYVFVWILSLYVLRSYKRYANRSVYFFGVVLGLTIVLIMYSLLPDNYRSSRAIILLGAGYILVSGWMVRLLVGSIKPNETSKTKRIGIVGNQDEYLRASKIIKTSLGSQVEMVQIPPQKIDSDKIVAEKNFNQLNELVFCLKDIPIEKVLEIMTTNIKGVSYKLFGNKSLSIIGSRRSNEIGEVYGIEIQYQIDNEHNRYYKRLIDFVFSLGLLLLFPIMILFPKYRHNLGITNLIKTIVGKYSLIGYNAADQQLNKLPKLKSCLIPNNNSVDREGMHQLNTAYALQYTPWRDVVLLLNTIF